MTTLSSPPLRVIHFVAMQILIVSILLLFSPFTLAQDAPKSMTKIVVHLEGPEIPAGSFVAKPKVLYRAGSRYCRIEEAEDPGNRIHGLLIVSEPDAWMVNLYDKTGRHVVDAGPTFNCRLPIFGDPNSKDETSVLVQNLEFGEELEFFKKMGAAPRPGPVEEGRKTSQYMIEVGNVKLILLTIGAPDERPLAVGRAVGEKGEVYIYTDYAQIPFDPKLFARPDGVTIQEIHP